VGETSLALRKRFPDARVLAFEPHHPTYERLRRNIEGEGIATFNLALGSTSRLAELFVYRFSTLNSLIEDAPYSMRFGEAATAAPVTVSTLDEFCSTTRLRRSTYSRSTPRAPISRSCAVANACYVIGASASS
jgi:FkbM family methyltransferase